MDEGAGGVRLVALCPAPPGSMNSRSSLCQPCAYHNPVLHCLHAYQPCANCISALAYEAPGAKTDPSTRPQTPFGQNISDQTSVRLRK